MLVIAITVQRSSLFTLRPPKWLNSGHSVQLRSGINPHEAKYQVSAQHEIATNIE